MNVAQIVAGFRSLPIYQTAVEEFGITSLSSFGAIGVIIEGKPSTSYICIHQQIIESLIGIVFTNKNIKIELKHVIYCNIYSRLLASSMLLSFDCHNINQRYKLSTRYIDSIICRLSM